MKNMFAELTWRVLAQAPFKGLHGGGEKHNVKSRLNQKFKRLQTFS